MSRPSYALPDQQKKALDYIILHIERHDQSPTLTEIGKAIGSKKQNVRVMIDALEEKGFISREPFKQRSIVVL